MTGWSETFNFNMPLSRITVGLLDDLGYDICYNAADIYRNPKTPWTNDIDYTFYVNSSNNLIVLDGNCFPVENSDLTYNIYTLPTNNLYYNGNTINNPINLPTGVNSLQYSPSTDFTGNDYFQYYVWYSDSDNSFIYSNLSIQ